MRNPIKTGLLSFGMSGKVFHAPFLAVHEGFELSAVVERSEKKAHLIYPKIKSFDSIDALLADPEIELVVVNTPTPTHFEFALNAIRAGKHVLVEKAFTITSLEAKLLYQEGKVFNRCVLPYQNRRFDSDFLSIKEVLESGKLGRLMDMYVRFDRYRPLIGKKAEKETPIPGSGLLYDLGPHLLDGVISVLGQPLKWTKALGHFRENTKVDDYVQINLSYPEEVQVYVSARMTVIEPQPSFILNGTKGTFVKSRTDIQEKQLLEGIRPDDLLYGCEEAGNEGILTTISPDGVKLQEKIASRKGSYLYLFEEVYKTIREGKPYFITEEQIIQQLEILEE
jgi:scyllo-inositol 2-dehydrogenase (NADP+)